MRLAILSDIHGNLPALEAVLTDLDRRGLDQIVNLGDNASGPLWPRETLALLRERTAWIHISGNHDRQLVRDAPESHGASDRYAYERLDAADLAWLATLPSEARLEDLLFCHGIPGDDNRYLLEEVSGGAVRLARASAVSGLLGDQRENLVLCGHSHTPRIVRLDAATTVANPGSVGLQAYEHDVPEPHVVEVGSPHARYLVLERQGKHWRFELVAVPYDHDAAAGQAARNGRPDWERALRTGLLRG
ncbi:MAG TPA: metallophosphoesterase family protein [Thermoanaerobaculia bacterium]|nr:metallophosphoesterase family protein [Thermoanaerobaculia bacterium]